ncbi:MAG: hypothetical protein KG012_15155 [Deltaproteobacteria bacterium]|nr:hypothetical protein [Deltaproteobacteria bacterium]
MNNLGDWVRKWSLLQPGKYALFFEGQPFAFQETNHRTNRLRHHLL